MSFKNNRHTSGKPIKAKIKVLCIHTVILDTDIPSQTQRHGEGYTEEKQRFILHKQISQKDKSFIKAENCQIYLKSID